MVKAEMKRFSVGLPSKVAGEEKALMGFFAILRQGADEPDSFAVNECHVNLWALKGILRRDFYWDVGLRIRAVNGDFHTFQLAIPSGVPFDGLTDLSETLLTPRIAEMIFGRPIETYGQKRQINYDGKGPILLSYVPSAEAALDSARSGSDFTLWTLKLANAIHAGTETYIRLRFAVDSIGRVWSWKRFGLSRYGSLVDVRFSDVREAWNVKDGDSLQQRIVPIEKLNFFVVAPSSFHLVETSPPVHYIRILEGRAWEKYLRRRVSLFGKEKLSIYQWRNPKGCPVTTVSPLRVYLDLSAQLSAFSLPNLLIATIGLLLLSGWGVTATPLIPPLLWHAGRFFWKHATAAVLLALLIVLWEIFGNFEMLQKARRALKRGRRQFEGWVLAPR
jgi:hypothetical protein